MIHQELNPIPRRSLAENIWIGRIPVKRVLGLPFVDHKKMYEDTQKLFDDLHMSHIDPQAQAMTVSASIIQLCDIARSVSYGAKIIIMDEPTSSLTKTETQLLFDIIRRLTAQGVGIVYISHKIDEILQISDEVTIMSDGRNVGTWDASELTEAKIVSNMVGREMTNWFPEKDNVPGETFLEVKNFSSVYDNSFQDCSFTVRKGEIFGIGGLVGAQRTELVEAVFGDRSIKSGETFISGKKVRIKSARDAIKNRMGLLTEERRATGIFPGLSVLDNVAVASLPH
jgi:methyl-galactoside transport system ATP-binding protein